MTKKKQEFYFEEMQATKLSKKAKTLVHDPAKSFKNRKEVTSALLLCIEENDPESFVEISEANFNLNF